jgi:hypothetical protein
LNKNSICVKCLELEQISLFEKNEDIDTKLDEEWKSIGVKELYDSDLNDELLCSSPKIARGYSRYFPI